MKFRPEQARWFEVYVPRNETVYTLEALARTGAVQLDQDVIGATRLDTRRIRQALARFDRLARRFADDLPEGEVSPARVLESPEDAAEQAVACLRTWCARLLVGGRRLRDVLKEKQQLEFLDELLVAMADDSRQVPALGQPTGLLCKCLYACTRGAGPGEVPEGVVTERVQGSDHDFFMMAGLPDSRAEVEQFVAVGDCREVTVPEWLPDDLSEQRREVRDRLSSLALRAGALQGELDAHRRDRKLLEALSNVAILRWYLEYAGMLTRDHSACHVTGWTSAGDSAVLEDALRKAHVNAVVLFPEAPAGKQAPARTSLAGWATPFRVFVEAMGAPGEHEIDPTPLLALVVPLLFGFMFPDIGHGIVLAATGLLLSRRYTAARLLVPCGLAAAIFGALFGEVFGIPGAMPALLGSPLEHPLGLIAASLLIGFALILLGMVFAGVEAYWRGELSRWLWVEGAVLVLYVAAAASLLTPVALAVAAVALGWYYLGVSRVCGRSLLGCLGRGTAHLAESVLQLGLNTLSFLRVGAFALAHAGLSYTVVELAGMADSTLGKGLVLVVGHALVITLEGLVVFVQTSRLILFEFFVRFLKAEGRPFKPVRPPPARHLG